MVPDGVSLGNLTLVCHKDNGQAGGTYCPHTCTGYLFIIVLIEFEGRFGENQMEQS